MADPLATLARRPRVALAALPTPLELAPNLSAELGVEVWLKRDDVGSLGLAGNKVRKLEFALAHAREQGATAVVTPGAAQSNHARTTAAAAARLGLRAILVMRGRADDRPPSGNLLLDALFGADVRFTGTDDWDELQRTVTAIAEEEKAYAMPAGGSSPVGALGFAAAHQELLGQLDAAGLSPQRIYHASTSCGTHAGLVLGRALAGRGPRARGFDVGRIVDDPPAAVARLANEAAALLGAGPSVVAEQDVDLDFSQLGDGYGAFTPEALAAIRLAARTEGVVLDPVYSAKAMAGLVADARAGRVDGPVVFWHTGGGPSLFAAGWGARILAG